METENKTMKGRLKKLGIGAFLFFLIKGLVWLAVLYGLNDSIKSCN
jgi:hypothetical protein